MLLNGGRHPFTNATVVPEDVVQHVSTGTSIKIGRPDYPEKVGCMQAVSALFKLSRAQRCMAQGKAGIPTRAAT